MLYEVITANFPAMEIRPGSMGRPLPGIEAAIVQRIDKTVEVIDKPDAQGELALAVALLLWNLV